MRVVTTMAAALALGIGLLNGLFGLALLSLWRRTGDSADAVSSTLLAEHSELISATTWKFFLLNTLAGGLLGLGSLLLLAIMPARGPGQRTVGASLVRQLVAVLVLLFYLTTRFLVLKPMFFDSLLNARGGVLRAVQNGLTANLSPQGVDCCLALLLVFCALIGGAGARRTNRFRRIAALLLAAGLVLQQPLIEGARASAWAPPGPSRRSTLSARPNILVIASDSLRPDRFSCNGYPRPTTQNIDRLQAAGLAFEQAFVPLARTLPSWVSLLTSTYPHTHGFRHMFPERKRRAIQLPLLTRLLSAEGYRSAVVSDYAGECFAMVDLGFDQVDVPPPTSVSILLEREYLRLQPYLAPFFDNRVGRGLLPLLSFLMVNPDPDILTDRVIRTIRAGRADHPAGRQARQPFFIVAFYSCTHIPYSAPYPYYDQFTDPEYQGAHKYGFGVTDAREIDQLLERPEERDRKQISDLYDGGVAAFDRSVGRLMGELDDLDLLANTVVVVTSDHGENIYDHGNLLEHGDGFRGGTAANRIPLIIYDPRPGSPTGAFRQPVSSLDLMPTLLGLLSLPAPPTAEGRDLLAEPPDGGAPQRPIFAETGLWLNGTGERLAGSDLEYPSVISSLRVDPLDGSLFLDPRFEPRMVAAKHRMVRLGDHKLIYEPTRDGADFKLFDWKADPANAHDLFETESARGPRDRLLRELSAWLLRAPGSGLDPNLRVIRKYTLFE